MNPTPGNAEPQLGAQTPAPTVRPIPAQGNALGYCGRRSRALKGRPNSGFRANTPTRKCAAPSWLKFFSSARPRALPWAGILCPVGAQEWPSLEQITHDLEGGETP